MTLLRSLLAVGALLWIGLSSGAAWATFDASSRSNNGFWTTSTSSYSWSHTVSGTNTFLAVAVSTYNAGLRTVTNITYNGVGLTKLGSQTAALESNNQDFEIWYMFGPATGTNTIQVTLSASTSFTQAVALSYNNIDSGPGIDSSGFGQSLVATNNKTQATTVVSSQAIMVSFAYSRIGAATTGIVGSTFTYTRQLTGDSLIAGDSGGNVPSGSQSLGFFKSGASSWPGIGTFSIVTTAPEGTPLIASKQTNAVVLEINAVDASKQTNAVVISQSIDLWSSKQINSTVITGDINASLTETAPATDALQIFPAGGGGGGAAGVFGGGQDGGPASFMGSGGFGGAADLLTVSAQPTPGADGNSGTEWNTVIGSGSGGAGGNYNNFGAGQSGGVGGSYGGGGGGGGGGSGGIGLGSHGGDGIIWIQYRSTSSGLLVNVTLTAGSGTWTVPADWNGSDNKIAMMGAGGCGSDATAFSGGNGGNGGSAVGGTNVTGLTPGFGISYHVNTAAEACLTTVVQTTFSAGTGWAAGAGANGDGGGGGGSAGGGAAVTFIYRPGLGGPGGTLTGFTVTPNAGGLHPWQPLTHW